MILTTACTQESPGNLIKVLLFYSYFQGLNSSQVGHGMCFKKQNNVNYTSPKNNNKAK